MVTWGVTKFFHKDQFKGDLDQFGQKRVGACRFTSKPRQQPLTEASTGVDHTSASCDDTNQLGANGSCSARGFHWETVRRIYDAFSVRGKKLEPVPSPRGGFGGLSPQTKLQAPKLKYEYYKLVEFLSNLNVKPPLHERQAPPAQT